jgi:signal transduction histidine kinase
MEDFREEFRITKSGYFIPGEQQGDGRDFTFVEDRGRIGNPRKTPDSWHELDLLYFGMYDRDGNVLGYIQPDYPVNGKIPEKETIESMEAYANIATIAVENSAMFKEVEDARNQVRMYLDLLTHDVGNLINPVNAYLEVVMGTTQLTPVQYKYLSSAQEAARSITHLVRNVRRSAQVLESAALELVPSSLTKTIRQTAAEAKGAYLSKKIDIKLHLPEKEVYVMADSFLDEVIYNLLTNAIKYDEHDMIDIDVELAFADFEGRSYAKVTVTDRGIGIPDEFKDRVFTREFKKLVRPDRLILQKSRGAGMGLSLVKSLVERYGGKIWVENRVYDDPSRGSAFSFIVPVT